MDKRTNVRLAPEVNRILFVKNLPFKVTSNEMYDLFGKYGAIRQIRVGDRQETRGSAFVVYEDIHDAKNALEHLNGFNVGGRYLSLLYFQPSKMAKSLDVANKKKELDELKAKYGLEKQNLSV